ncbi:hypothetical protein ACSFA2_03765 [Variovorax sp. LT2P21]|uniref:hypothetical protein n=1 Tax=Variovorax sp. LT2P21 TaxID=3443731 RepID=UPI003F4455A8
MQAGLAARPLTKGRLPVRAVVDSAYAAYTGHAAFTGIIPLDNTIPQIGEGDQILSLSFTPKSVTNKLRLRFRATASVTNLNNVIAAIFVGTGANAVAAAVYTNAAPNYFGQLVLEAEVPVGTSGAITIQVRMGLSSAGTYGLNDQAGSGPIFGGATAATLVVEELTP